MAEECEIKLESADVENRFLKRSFWRDFDSGAGKAIIDGNEYVLADGSVIIVPAGAEHNIINTSETEDLKLYTIYSPPHHKDGIARATKAEAEANEVEFDGVATE